jgi:V/A-type H+-transporting ATPase subunit C
MMDVEPDLTRAMKTFRRVPKYGHAVGRVMVHESTLLNRQRMERLLEFPFEESLAVLMETEYGRYLEGAKVASDVEEGLLEFLRDQYGLLDDICKGTFVPRFMRLKYDFHNLKVLLKRRYTDGAVEDLFSGLGSIDVHRMKESFEASHAGDLPPEWEKLMLTLKEALQPGGNPQEVDSTVDRLFLEERLAVAKRERSRFLVDFSRACIDVANLKIILRGRMLEKEKGYYDAALASGGRLDRRELIQLALDTQERLTARLLATRYGRMLEDVLKTDSEEAGLTSLDRGFEEYLLEKLSGMKRMALGPERIIRYIITRENEVALLRITLMGKLHGLAPRVIQERLSPAFLKGVV